MINSSDAEKFLKDRKVNTTFSRTYLNEYVSYGLPSNPTDVFSKLLENRIIMLTGEIDDYLCDLIKAQLLYMENLNNKDITIYICSGGGDVYSGLGLIDTMEYIKPDIITVNTGIAASMAALILCSGTKGKRKALKRSRTMIHQPMSGMYGMHQASDLTIEAKEINSLKHELYEIVSESTGVDIKKVEQDSDRNYWMNSTEALKYGMIDEIIKRK